jgi:REP element-mobilizing transposase RayT
MRGVQFSNGEYYHVFNRGIDKREIFVTSEDYFKFLMYMKAVLCPTPEFLKTKPPSKRFNLEKLIGSVEMIAYCLNLNHFHFILRQLKEAGISNFMHFLGTSYTMFFNAKYERSGSLFQGPFKAIHIDSNEYLLWVSAYINGNAQIHGLIKNAAEYQWCSYPDYLGLRNGTFCSKNIILGQFKDSNEYKEFVEENILAMKERKDLQKYLIEN